MNVVHHRHVASTVVKVELDVEHAHVVELEIAIATLRLAQNSNVVHQLHTQFFGISCGGNTLGVIAIVIASPVDGSQDARMLQ